MTTTTSRKLFTKTDCPSLAALCAGPWDLHRSIAHADGTQATFTGKATWTMTGQGRRARCEEVGTLEIANSAPVTAHQTYIWDKDLNVYFQDGRFFHQVPRHGGPVLHDCPPDTYCGSYTFADATCFVVEWQVNGPRKSYLMHSRYSRSLTPGPSL